MSKRKTIYVFLGSTVLGIILAGVLNIASWFEFGDDATVTADVNDSSFLTGAPLLQPSDHNNYWELGGSGPNSCLICHTEGAKEKNQYASTTYVPTDHFINGNSSEGLVTGIAECITCHPMIID